MMIQLDKRPREYASDYMEAKTKKEKQEIVNSIPSHLKKLTKAHINNIKTKEKQKNDYYKKVG